MAIGDMDDFIQKLFLKDPFTWWIKANNHKRSALHGKPPEKRGQY